MADKTLVHSGNGLFIILEAVVVILIPWFVSQCWVQLYHVTLSGEQELRREAVHYIVCVKQLHSVVVVVCVCLFVCSMNTGRKCSEFLSIN